MATSVVDHGGAGGVVGRGEVPSGRWWAFRVAVALPLLVLVVPLWKINAGVVTVWLPSSIADPFHATQLARDGIEFGTFSMHRVHYLTLAVSHIAVIVALSLQLRRPRAFAAPMWQAAVGLLLSLATWPFVDTSAIPGVVPVLLGLVILAALLHPDAPLTRLPQPVDRPMVVLWVLLAGPLALYTWGQERLQVTGVPGDAHWHGLHYNFMGEFGLQLLAVGLIATTALSGWRVSAWIGGAMAALVGIGFIVHPGQVSSRGFGWGVAMVGWAAVWAVAAERRARATADSAG